MPRLGGVAGGEANAYSGGMTQKPETRSDVVIMFFSAAIFAFFGFRLGQGSLPVALYLLIIWSLRGGAVLFGLSGILALARVRMADVLYAVAGAVTGVLFIIAGVWLLLVAGIGNATGIILLLFGLWNSYSALRSLGLTGARSPTAPHDEIR